MSALQGALWQPLWPTCSLRPIRASRQGPKGSTLGRAPPVPTKLAAKMKRGEFIEMAELLPEFWFSTREDDHSKQEAKSRRARSVQDIFTWLQCYSLYVSVIGPQHPSRIPELMAYQANIVRASQNYAGLAWVCYESAFRRQAALTGLTRWSAINPTLYTLCFAGSARTAMRCELCFTTTHHTKECAQQGDPDPGVREHLRAIEKAVLSLTPGAGPSAAVLPRGGGPVRAPSGRVAVCGTITSVLSGTAVTPTFVSTVVGGIQSRPARVRGPN